MTLNETNILCEALEHFIACLENTSDSETVRVAEKLLSRTQFTGALLAGCFGAQCTSIF